MKGPWFLFGTMALSALVFLITMTSWVLDQERQAKEVLPTEHQVAPAVPAQSTPRIKAKTAS